MNKRVPVLDNLSQNNQLPLRIVSPGFGHLSPAEASSYSKVHRSPYYFFLLMLEGSSRHTVDLHNFEVNNNELLFIMPHQLHEQQLSGHGTDYFKIGFDERCLALLPTQYTFLVDPLNSQKIKLASATSSRLKAVFSILVELLQDRDTNPALLLAHLNSLLTEINAAYFSGNRVLSDQKLSTYIDFKIFVENNLTDHPTISQIAQALAVNTNGLYQIVKQYSGLSPKEFITNRLIVEARRRLYYNRSSSVKDLAFELGFNDPEYFSRLFKKITGKSVSGFFQDLSGY